MTRLTLDAPERVYELANQDVTDLYNKIHSVESNLADLKTSTSEMNVMLRHIDDDFNRLEKVLSGMENIFFGKDATMGLISRVISLEKAEEKRQANIRWLWTAIVMLILEEAFRYLGSGF